MRRRAIRIMQRIGLPTDSSRRIDGNIVHFRPFHRSIIFIRHSGRRFVQVGLLVKGEVFISGDAPAQPCLRMIQFVCAFVFLSGRDDGGAFHKRAGDFAVQRRQHVTYNVGSVHMFSFQDAACPCSTARRITCRCIARRSRAPSIPRPCRVPFLRKWRCGSWRWSAKRRASV